MLGDGLWRWLNGKRGVALRRWKMGVEPKNRGILPQNGWFIIMEKPMNKWMIWGYHYFWKHPSSLWLCGKAGVSTEGFGNLQR